MCFTRSSSDILESYSRSPFLGTDANFLDPHMRGEQQGTVFEVQMYNTVSYENMVKLLMFQHLSRY